MRVAGTCKKMTALEMQMSDMATMAEKPPFRALTFSFNDRAHGRMTVRAKYLDAEARSNATGPVRGFEYQLHVEAGPAERTTTDFTKGMGMATARTLIERLLDAGAFSWDESYPDDPQAGVARWMLGIVFEPDVFEIRSRGGSAYPQGFDAMMDALYDLGLPRPGSDDNARVGFSGIPFGEASVAGMPFNAQSMQGLMKAFEGMAPGGMEGFDLSDLQRVMADLQSDPQRMQDMLRSEFRSMPAEQQNAMLDLLASTGIATRQWWEDFLRGL